MSPDVRAERLRQPNRQVLQTFLHDQGIDTKYTDPRLDVYVTSKGDRITVISEEDTSIPALVHWDEGASGYMQDFLLPENANIIDDVPELNPTDIRGFVDSNRRTLPNTESEEQEELPEPVLKIETKKRRKGYRVIFIDGKETSITSKQKKLLEKVVEAGRKGIREQEIVTQLIEGDETRRRITTSQVGEYRENMNERFHPLGWSIHNTKPRGALAHLVIQRYKPDLEIKAVRGTRKSTEHNSRPKSVSKIPLEITDLSESTIWHKGREYSLVQLEDAIRGYIPIKAVPVLRELQAREGEALYPIEWANILVPTDPSHPVAARDRISAVTTQFNALNTIHLPRYNAVHRAIRTFDPNPEDSRQQYKYKWDIPETSEGTTTAQTASSKDQLPKAADIFVRTDAISALPQVTTETRDSDVAPLASEIIDTFVDKHAPLLKLLDAENLQRFLNMLEEEGSSAIIADVLPRIDRQKFPAVIATFIGASAIDGTVADLHIAPEEWTVGMQTEKGEMILGYMKRLPKEKRNLLTFVQGAQRLLQKAS